MENPVFLKNFYIPAFIITPKIKHMFSLIRFMNSVGKISPHIGKRNMKCQEEFLENMKLTTACRCKYKQFFLKKNFT
jgi:hypothetical protein